jgi:hypothetical protein
MALVGTFTPVARIFLLLAVTKNFVESIRVELQNILLQKFSKPAEL